jgi:hypothetical protein
MCLTILGEIEHLQERHDLAFHYHKRALMNAEECGNLFGITQSLAHMGCACYALEQTEDGLNYFRRGLSFMHSFMNVDTVFLTIFGIAGIHELRGRPEVTLDLLAILVHHPQYGSPVFGPTVGILNKRLRSKLPGERIASVMEQADQGHLSNRLLESHFTISLELVSQLEELLEEAGKI